MFWLRRGAAAAAAAGLVAAGLILPGRPATRAVHPPSWPSGATQPPRFVPVDPSEPQPPPARLPAGVAFNTDISGDPTRVHNEPFIAVDRNRPQRLLAASNELGNFKPLALFWSGDGGMSWTTTTMPLGNALSHADPGVAFDSKGNAYASALGRVLIPAEIEIQVVRSMDNGQTWSMQPSVVHSAPGNDKPLLAVNDQTGTTCPDLACVAWNEQPTLISNNEIHVACSPQAAGPWLVQTLASGTGLNAATPAFGPNGVLHVAWVDVAGLKLEIRRANTCGVLFGAANVIASLRVGYGLFIPAICVRGAHVYPAMDIDRRTGAIYVAWTDAAPGAVCPTLPPNPCDATTACRTDVFFARSTDGGKIWSPPTLLHSDIPSADQFNPWLAVDGADGSVNVVWYDTRNDPQRIKTDLYYRRSLDGGSTWEPEMRVSSVATDESTSTTAPSDQHGDYTGLTAEGCRMHPVWVDRRGGKAEQIYTSFISTAPILPDDIGNTLLGVRDKNVTAWFSWTDLGGSESDYLVYRRSSKDPVADPPELIGSSGGGDATTLRDPTNGGAGSCFYYTVAAAGPCP